MNKRRQKQRHEERLKPAWPKKQQQPQEEELISPGWALTWMAIGFLAVGTFSYTMEDRVGLSFRETISRENFRRCTAAEEIDEVTLAQVSIPAKLANPATDPRTNMKAVATPPAEYGTLLEAWMESTDDLKKEAAPKSGNVRKRKEASLGNESEKAQVDPDHQFRHFVQVSQLPEARVVEAYFSKISTQ